MKRPDRTSRLLKVIGIFQQIETERFYTHDEEIIDYLRGQLYDATKQLTANDTHRIRGYSFEAIQAAHKQQEIWDAIEAEIATTNA